MRRSRRVLILLASGSIVLGCLQGGCASEAAQAEAQPPTPAAPPSASLPQPSVQELDQLVAPIALYPDALVAQILAAATYPTEIVEADRWLQQHPDLKGDALATAIDAQSWDPGVKALIQFPGLLGMMDKNLSWTSSLGQAYVNGQQDVLAAVQVMRQRAQQAGNLKSTPQESVTTQGNTIVIEPANPQVVYVPQYDPWVVYGDPLAFYPGWIGVPGFFFDGPGIGFGVGIGIGLFGSFGWGWHHWGTDWHGHGLIHGDRPYFSHSREFGNRNGFGGGSGAVDGGASYGMHSSAFSGFNHGGEARGFSSRGRTSFGGGSHGGGFAGGGFHGGGGGGHR
ncbi:MAG TPA: DUF3300 domain-containing protein [Steroidobacteraceae bacterium]|nr:DUF3300 domain-containing protein [Steroidobacteraceae bacterium]